MTRTTSVLTVAVGLCAWASAQTSPVGLTAAEQLKLLRANRPLVEDLLDHGLKLATTDTPVGRAEECQRTTRTLGLALRWEAENAADPGRVSELSDHLTVVIRDGLAPTLEDGLRTVPPQSPDFQRLVMVRDAAGKDLRSTSAAIPTDGKLGTAPQVRDARTRLADAVRLLGPN